LIQPQPGAPHANHTAKPDQRSRQNTGQPQIPAPISGQNKCNSANHSGKQD
jgi:hypothetical protein